MTNTAKFGIPQDAKRLEILAWAVEELRSACAVHETDVSEAAELAFHRLYAAGARMDRSKPEALNADRSRMKRKIRDIARLAYIAAVWAGDGELQAEHIERSAEFVGRFNPWSTVLCDHAVTNVEARSA